MFVPRSAIPSRMLKWISGNAMQPESIPMYKILDLIQQDKSFYVDTN